MIVLDQFEELFVRYDEAFRQQFAQLVPPLSRGFGGAEYASWFLCGKSFWPGFGSSGSRSPTCFTTASAWSRSLRKATRAAIMEPAGLFGIEVEEGWSSA